MIRTNAGAVEKAVDDIENLEKEYTLLPVAICTYIFYWEMSEGFRDAMQDFVSMLTRDQKENKQHTINEGGILHSLTQMGDVIDMDFWMKTQGSVNKCGDDFMELKQEHEDEVFALAICIYFNSLSESDILTIERIRFLNSRLKDKQNKITDLLYKKN